MSKTRVSERRPSVRTGRSALRSHSGGGLRQKIAGFKFRRSGSGRKTTEMHPSAYSARPQSQIPNYEKMPYNYDPLSPKAYGGEATERDRRKDYSRGTALPTPSRYHPSSNLPGPEEYIQFYWKCNDLLSELARLKFALRTVGSCGPGIQAINATITSFENLQWLFGFNTYSLFPQPQDPRFKYLQTRNDSYLSKFSGTLASVSEALELTEKAFDTFKGAYYENSTMYLLMCLQKRFKSEAKKAAIGRGYRPSPPSDELKKRIQFLLNTFVISAVEALRKDLSKYCDKGVPVISSTQKVMTTRYLNLTTIATFLSGVTATFLSLSAGDTSGVLAVGVNTFLFSSLTFSIASAINSLLAMTWQKSIVRDPNTYMPLWISACLNTGPMISLVISVIFFAVALCLFVFSSSQHVVTTAVTVSFAGLQTACLFLLAVWLIFEKWNFRHVAGSVGQKLTSDSLSLAIIDWIVLWPEKLSAAFTDSKDPESSRLEQGKYRYPPASYMSDRPAAYAVFDGLSNNFLSGTQPSVGRSRFSRPGDSQFDNGGPSSRPRPVPEPRIPGYAPTEFDEHEEGGVSSNYPDGMERWERVRRPPVHFEDEDYMRPESPEPIIVQPPPVNSQTYETALFLPRNEQGEYEDTDTASVSGESDGGDAPYNSMPSPPGPPVLAPMPIPPGLSVPTPMPTSYSEQVMVIPTNPPTYVVPPGSYVAYGTQPIIGPSTQAGNYSIYNPEPFDQRRPVSPYAAYPVPPKFEPRTPEMPPVIPPTAVRPSAGPPLIPTPPPAPAPYIPSYGSSREVQPPEPARRTHVIIRDDYESPDYDRVESYTESQPQYADRTSSTYWYQRRTSPLRRDSDSNPVQAQQSTIDGPHVPRPTSQYGYGYPARSYPRPPRRSSTGSSQVRFARPIVAQPPRRQSTAERSDFSRARSTVSYLSQPFTEEPEQLEQTGLGESESRQEPVVSRSHMEPSSLDMLQHRPRRSSSSYHEYYAERSRSNPGIREMTGAPESLAAKESEPPESPDLSQRDRRSDRERSDSAGRNRPHVLTAMSTIEEATRSSVLDDSDSSVHSATTAPETMDMDAERGMFE